MKQSEQFVCNSVALYFFRLRLFALAVINIYTYTYMDTYGAIWINLSSHMVVVFMPVFVYVCMHEFARVYVFFFFFIFTYLFRHISLSFIVL